MNEYRITYDTTEGNAQLTIIERSEATARRAFKANHKGAEISDIELIDGDVSATKDQERETLEKIKAMVAELGPQSYQGGCHRRQDACKPLRASQGLS